MWREKRRVAMLPFSQAEFLAAFVRYNLAVWPAQVVAYLFGAVAVLLLALRGRRRPLWADRAITLVLAAMWLWTGVAYHALVFSAINNAAWLFAALFVAQAGLFAVSARRDRIEYRLEPTWPALVGIGFIVYAMILYPLIGVATGHRYPELPMFGITPCPVTIFTFGLLLVANRTAPRHLLAIPLVWSVIGGSAAFLLGVRQDWLLLVSGIITTALWASRRADRDRAAQAER